MDTDAAAARPLFPLAGILAGIVFIAVTLVEIFARPGFDISRHAISMLSLGERGWLMAATFVASGVLVLVVAIGLWRTLSGGPGRRAGPLLVGLYGVGLVVAGLFPAPAGLGFPPGTPETQQPVMDGAAIMHSLAFMTAFGSLIVAALVFARRFFAMGARGAAALSAATGLALPLLIAIGMAGLLPPGVAFYIAAVLAWVWLAGTIRVATAEN